MPYLWFIKQTKTNNMKNYQIKFILKLQNGDSFKLEQQVISVEASNKKDALNNGKIISIG